MPKAIKARWSAAVPLLTAKQYLKLNLAANLFSNSSTSAEAPDKFELFNASMTYFLSALFMSGW